MLHLRDVRGNAVALTADVRFIEFHDATGKVARLLIIKNDNSVLEVIKGSKEAEIYEKNFNVQFCPIIQIPQEYIKESI